MPTTLISTSAIHFCSQMAYLDTVPAMAREGPATVGVLAAYYLKDEVGRVYLRSRFGDIPKEYDYWLDFLEREAEQYRDWQVVDVMNDNTAAQTGFYGCTFLGPDGQRVVAFRGSEMLGNRKYRNDYETDLALSYMDPTPQQRKVEDYWSRYGRVDYNGLAVTGHSLGGNLAAYGVVRAPAHIRKSIQCCLAFNAPGFSREFVEKNAESLQALEGKLVLYQNKYDPVSSLLTNPVDPVIVASVFLPEEQETLGLQELFYPHSNFVYQTDSQGELVLEPDGKKSRFCELAHHLSELFMRLPRFVRKDISRVILETLYSTPADEKRGRYVLEALTGYIAHNELFGESDHLDGAAVAFAARMLESGTDAAKLCDIIAHTDCEENTLLLSGALLLLLEGVKRR